MNQLIECEAFVVTSSNFIEEYPKKVFLNEEEAIDYKEENTTEDYNYYVHKCPLIVDRQSIKNLLTLFNK